MLTRSGLILSSLILGQITISLCARLGLVVAFEPVQSASVGEALGRSSHSLQWHLFNQLYHNHS